MVKFSYLQKFLDEYGKLSLSPLLCALGIAESFTQ